MNGLTDQQLLREYAERRSEAAFAELVRRHVDLVYSAALRMVCDSHLAEDVTQGAFVALARSAPQLTDRAVLSGWLHRTAQNIAAQTVRTDVRRRAREQEAAAMNELFAAEPDGVWEHIAPHLDAALGELSEADRDALMLRYFERKSAQEMAQVLGVSDEAAQKRVSRAVERLREFFAKRGVTVGASGLVVVLSANAVQAAPVGLAISISTAAALAATTFTTTATAIATKAIAMTTLQKTSIAVALVAASVTIPLVVQHQTQIKLREENQSLRQQVEQLAELTAENERLSKLLAEAKNSPVLRLPAPPMAAAAPVETATDDLRSTNLIAQLLKGGDAPKLTAAQIDSYLKENRRNAASLLAAYRATNDPKLLLEAMEKFPDDPQVAFHAVFKKDASPEERRQWLEAFKRNAPDNALPSYLSALDYFKTGQADQAVQELVAAPGRQQFQDYSADSVQNDEEAWRTAGYSVAESKTLASMLLVLPHLAQLKELSQNMVSLANSYRQAGDEASAQAALQMGVNLGQHLDGSPGKALINQLVGVAIQSIALRAMDPNAPYGSAGQTVQNHLDELTRQRAGIRELTSQFDSLQQRMSDQDWISYKDRWRAFGEEAALRWMVSKHGQQ
ncbi:MAG TPA: sigma-70 family RNA polymerase sigma factor [Methylomirabilota bacterium]|nr:sigma-70 family RNA polymerase sigma factor [Methylomirabilota bacterium]